MAKHNFTSLTRVAAALVVAYGYIYCETWQVGSETPYIIFQTKDGKTYSLEFGGGDNPYLFASVWLGDARMDYEREDEVCLASDIIWELKLEGEPSLETNGPFETDDGLLLWAIGALAAFLYDLREGKING